MDLTTLIVDLLRKKEEEEALNAGGPTAGASPTPTPATLGSGAASKAALELLKRKSAPMEYVDSVQ